MLTTGCADVVQNNIKHGRIATTPISASIIGAIQVQEAMKIIHKEELEEGIFDSLLGKMFKYEGMKFSSKVFKYETYNQDCPAHENWASNVVESKHFTADMEVKEALSFLKEELGVRQVEINLRNNKFIEKIISKTDEQEFLVMMPESRLNDFIDSDALLRNLRYKGLQQIKYENIDKKFPYQNLMLNQIGVAYFDILQVSTEKGFFYVELSKDKEKFQDVLM